ncbi:hypothetical protein ABT234_30650 [Streptomyces sp. NPDC001586]|uniref:hypothetical protein n=1 Tax=Streptomyces sp. NPDC001586 TaxID=3154387 RepID=UPI0033337884
MSTLMPFVVAVEPEDLQLLNKVVKAGRDAEVEWLAQAREARGIRFLRGKALSQARSEIRQEFNRLRERGTLAGTRDLVVARHVQAELKHRGMTGPFETVPAEESGMPGRRVGTGPRHYDHGPEDSKFSGRMPVRLPAALGDRLVRACHWTSAPAVEALWEWQTRWGDGPEVKMREAQRSGAPAVLGLCAAFSGPRPDADNSILQKAQLQQQVVTTGDVIRASVKRALR